MKILISFLMFFTLLFSSFSNVSAGFFDSFISDGAPDIRYCADGQCGLDEGIEVIEDELNDIVTDRTFSQYIQDVVIYLLTFISIIAVLYIIYAGFMILIWNGEEEKAKKSKQTIIFVIVGILIIWLAWPITKLILRVLG